MLKRDSTPALPDGGPTRYDLHEPYKCTQSALLKGGRTRFARESRVVVCNRCTVKRMRKAQYLSVSRELWHVLKLLYKYFFCIPMVGSAW